MKKSILLLVITLQQSLAMELQEFKLSERPVRSDLLADVVKVSQISRVLFDAGLSGQMPLADITVGKCSYFVRPINNSFAYTKSLTPNYFKAQGKIQESVTSGQSRDLFNISYRANKSCRHVSDLKDFFFDGPNKKGVCIASSRAAHAAHYLNVASNVDSPAKPYCSQPMENLYLWSVALSEGNRAVYSGTSTISRYAILLCRQIKEEITRSKFLMFENTNHTVSWDAEQNKVCKLVKNNHHVFEKMSFITENLLIGLDQQGQLYSIITHFDDPAQKPEFHKLAFTINNAHFLRHFALDTYDKHTMVLLDEAHDFYIGRITAQNLMVKKIDNLENLLSRCKNCSVTLSQLRSIRLVGSTCYFIFCQNSDQELFLKIELVSKSPLSDETNSNHH